MLRLFVRGSRQSSANLCESLLTSSKCEKTAIPALTATNECGSKWISTSTRHLCDKKDGDAAVSESGNGNVAEEKKDDKKAQPKPIASAKGGKENLIALLGNMKVEVTNKRLVQQQQTQFSSQPKAPRMESTISMFQRATVEASSQSETLDPKLVAAASAAASTLPDQKKAESELLLKLRQNEVVTDAQKKGNTDNLGRLIAHMRVGKEPNQPKIGGTSQILFDDDGQGFMPDRNIPGNLEGVWKLRNLFSERRLNIFSPPEKEKMVDVAVGRPTLWEVEFANELSQVSSQAPRNGFEEMIQWTKEGKLWEYPIDNAAGLDEEKNVPFHEHIFLEKHLEEGFPTRGPVRHFMELVVAGLSKNPYLSVAQKKEHISWFRDYFHQKQDILKEAEMLRS
ncbi:small ribosomal subunit protein mS31 [Neosynchiropus ocellatus]